MIFHKSVILMEIWDYYMRLAFVKGRSLQLKALQGHKLEETSKQAMQGALLSFMQANGLAKGTEILLLIRSSEAMFRFVELPRLPIKELRKLARMNCRSYLPVSPEDYITDYRILETTNSASRVEFAAFPRNIAEGYATAFKELGLTPIRFELYQNAVADYFVSLGKGRLLAVSRWKDRITVVLIGSGGMQGVKELTVCDERQLEEEISKLPGYFVYAPVDTIYFMEDDHEEALWSAAFPHCSFTVLSEPHLALQALAELY